MTQEQNNPSDNNTFGEDGHTAETTTEEYFDRISKENYERLDAELDQELVVDRIKEPFVGNRSLRRAMSICFWLFLGFIVGSIAKQFLALIF